VAPLSIVNEPVGPALAAAPPAPRTIQAAIATTHAAHALRTPTPLIVKTLA
jgi:hypothetical protein